MVRLGELTFYRIRKKIKGRHSSLVASAGQKKCIKLQRITFREDPLTHMMFLTKTLPDDEHLIRVGRINLKFFALG